MALQSEMHFWIESSIWVSWAWRESVRSEKRVVERREGRSILVCWPAAAAVVVLEDWPMESERRPVPPVEVGWVWVWVVGWVVPLYIGKRGLVRILVESGHGDGPAKQQNGEDVQKAGGAGCGCRGLGRAEEGGAARATEERSALLLRWLLLLLLRLAEQAGCCAGAGGLLLSWLGGAKE